MDGSVSTISFKDSESLQGNPESDQLRGRLRTTLVLIYERKIVISNLDGQDLKI